MPTSKTVSQAPNAMALAPSLGHWETARLTRGGGRRASPYPSLPKNSPFPAFLSNHEALEIFFFLAKAEIFHCSPWFWVLGFNPSVRCQEMVMGCVSWLPVELFSNQLCWELDLGIHAMHSGSISQNAEFNPKTVSHSSKHNSTVLSEHIPTYHAHQAQL